MTDNEKLEKIITSETGEVIDISSGGTYILKSGKYNSTIFINTTEPVTLRLDGDITFTGKEKFIYVDKQCDLMKV